jgi:hypothetical protein
MYKYIIPLLLACVLFNASCKKCKPQTIDGYTKHHGKVIAHCKVYYKKGTSNFPGEAPSAYDDHTLSDATGYYKIEKLKEGSYYLYSTGYDSSLADNVSGGRTVHIPCEKKAKTMAADIAITED